MRNILIYILPFLLLFTQNCKTTSATSNSTEQKESKPQVQIRPNSTSDSIFSINALEMYNGLSQAIYLKADGYSGEFSLVNNTSLENDGGVVFPAKTKGENWHWVRTLNNQDLINLKWFGAKGLGISSYKADSAALVNSIKYIKNIGGGKLYIPASNSFYAFNGNGIVLPDNIEIYGDGPKSEIKHVNPESGTYYKGVIFFTSTYGPNSSLGIAREPIYPIKDAFKNQSYVIVNNTVDFQKLKLNSLIGLAANFFLKNENIKKPRFSEFEINEIIKLSKDTVFLKYPLSVSLIQQTAKSKSNKNEETGLSSQSNTKNSKKNSANPKGGAPVIINANSDFTFNERLGVFDRLTKNISIHDLTLSQADRNMINNTKYNADELPGNVIALGGTFNSTFYNLTMNSFGNFGGNMYNRCDIHHINFVSSRKLIDFGYGSANTKIHDIDWLFKNSILDTISRSFAYINDGTHDIEIYNIKASGDWSGNNLFQIAGGAHHINLHDINLEIPNYNAPDKNAISIRDDNFLVYAHDILFENIIINLGTIKTFINIKGDSAVLQEKNIKFNNVTFKGTAINGNKNFSIIIKNCPNLFFKNVTFTSGNILFENIGGSTIENLIAPQAEIEISNNYGAISPRIINSKYKRILKD